MKVTPGVWHIASGWKSTTLETTVGNERREAGTCDRVEEIGGTHRGNPPYEERASKAINRHVIIASREESMICKVITYSRVTG